MQGAQAAACRCLHRLIDGGAAPKGVRIGDLVARHTHPDTRSPERLWHIDWESVLAEVILASARQGALATERTTGIGSHAKLIARRGEPRAETRR